MDHYPYIIVGAGIAGVKAAEAIRGIDPSGPILLLSSENRLPYKRTKIDKHLSGGFSRDDFILYPSSWYGEMGIELQCGTRIASLLPGEKRIVTERGQQFSFAGLLLSTGAQHTVPEQLKDKTDLFHIVRSAREAESVIETLGTASRVTVLGGGIQGVEMADQCLQAGKEVILVHRGSHILSKHLPEDYARELESEFIAAGLKIFSGNTIGDLERTGSRKLIVHVKGQSLAADLLLVSVGVKPDTRLAREAGIEVDGGIVINDRFETSAEAVFAAGDCARMRSGYFTELWHGAEYQGTLAGKSMAGSPEPFVPKQFRLKCEVLNTYLFSQNFDRSGKLVRKEFNGGGIRQTWFIEDGTVRGVVMKNDKDRAKIYEKAVYERWPLDRVTEELSIGRH